MPTLMPSDTTAALGSNAEKCDSRSLLLERFADPTAKEGERKNIFTRTFNKPVNHSKSISHVAFGASLAGNTILHAQLQSRLMVNMAGGVMENAGLCLDRFGLPYIPGSAVKGCARRAATQALLEAESWEAKADLLFELCLVFGWGDTDWKAGRKRKRANGREVETEPLSDFWWAMASETGNRAEDDRRRGEIWQRVVVPVTNRLLDQLRVQKREHPNEPWRDLPNFAGSVSFLPAYPVDLGKTGKVDGLPLEVPPLGKLELDVVTCHHRDYYAGKSPTATDTEEPVPVVFPAVAPGHVFAFAFAPLRGAVATLVQHARSWLATGLSVFGLGAKTNAGYGWFDCSETVHTAVTELLHQKAEREKKAAEEKAAKEKAEAEAKAKATEKAARDAALASLSGDERADKEIELLTDQQFDAKVRAFCKEPKKGGPTEEQKKAIVRALRGPRLAYWQAFKTKATKGDLATVDQAIRQLSKAMNLGKMP
jgi:CRISPR type III-B/RAMP module RAMP protein Cmr6